MSVYVCVIKGKANSMESRSCAGLRGGFLYAGQAVRPIVVGGEDVGYRQCSEPRCMA